MATNLGQWERERFNYGESAGDGRGDFLRVHAIKAEDTNAKLFTWLSGGASEVTLPNALPISRGGTGATTVAALIKSIGFFIDANYVLRRGLKVISVTDKGITDNFNNVPTARFERISLGTYSLTGFEVSNNMWEYVIPLNTNGLPKYIIERSSIGDVMTLTCYEANTDVWPIAKGALIDIKDTDVINFEVK